MSKPAFTSKNYRFIDLSGRKIGFLFVLGPTGRSAGKKVLWNCVCECGREKIVVGSRLRAALTTSCGCKRKSRKTLIRNRTYHSWAMMIQRCTNPNNPKFRSYGGRGITVCEQWRKYSVFLSDMGDCPECMSIDRIDNNGIYEPNNCRWADKLTQANNTRSNRFITANGKTMTAAQWSRETGVSSGKIRGRLAYGWSPEKAVC